MWTETKTNDQFSSTGSQIFCLRKDTCSKLKPRQNWIEHGLQLLVTPMTSFKTSLRNTGWATRYLSDVWLSTNGVLHCESYNLQVGANKNSHWRGRNDHSRGRNVQVAKRPGGEASSEGAKRQRGETSINRGRWSKTAASSCCRNSL